MIEQYYDYDNDPFLEALEARGFYVADCSQSNYARTFSSLSASLNMRYMSESTRQELIGNAENYIDVHSQNNEVVIKNEVRRFLEEFSYRTVAFQTGFPHTEWRDADLYFSRDLGNLEIARLRTNINPFEQMLLETTPGLILLDASTVINQSFIAAVPESFEHRHYLILTNTFDKLETMPSIPGRKFVFAHMVSPHIPYSVCIRQRR